MTQETRDRLGLVEDTPVYSSVEIETLKGKEKTLTRALASSKEEIAVLKKQMTIVAKERDTLKALNTLLKKKGA